MSESPTSTPPPRPVSTGPVNKHAPTAIEKQRMQLERLLKDPEKLVNLPKAPTEKTLRAPREMMKNVQGSSAGAGSGEFHVYKQNRRREYERLKLMDEKSKREEEAQAFEQRKREREDSADAKTAKNRAKRLKKKQARSGGSKKKGSDEDEDEDGQRAVSDGGNAAPLKKRRVLGGDGKVIAFRRPGEADSDDEEGPAPDASVPDVPEISLALDEPAPAVYEPPAIVIHDED